MNCGNRTIPLLQAMRHRSGRGITGTPAAGSANTPDAGQPRRHSPRYADTGHNAPGKPGGPCTSYRTDRSTNQSDRRRNTRGPELRQPPATANAAATERPPAPTQPTSARQRRLATRACDSKRTSRLLAVTSSPSHTRTYSGSRRRPGLSTTHTSGPANQVAPVNHPGCAAVPVRMAHIQSEDRGHLLILWHRLHTGQVRSSVLVLPSESLHKGMPGEMGIPASPVRPAMAQYASPPQRCAAGAAVPAAAAAPAHPSTISATNISNVGTSTTPTHTRAGTLSNAGVYTPHGRT